jgi:hypothetical protein
MIVQSCVFALLFLVVSDQEFVEVVEDVAYELVFGSTVLLGYVIDVFSKDG